jgi:hypothetical protein
VSGNNFNTIGASHVMPIYHLAGRDDWDAVERPHETGAPDVDLT